MQTETSTKAGERTQAVKGSTLFAEYRGRRIDVASAGHPQCQNIFIDGKPAGYVVFPTGAISTARQIIDAQIGTSQS